MCSLEAQADFATRDKVADEALAELRMKNDALVLQKSCWEDVRRAKEQHEQLTALISEVQTEYSQVRMKLDKTDAEERLAKVRMLSLLAQTVTNGRCTRATRDTCVPRSLLSSHAWRNSRTTYRSLNQARQAPTMRRARRARASKQYSGALRTS